MLKFNDKTPPSFIIIANRYFPHDQHRGADSINALSELLNEPRVAIHLKKAAKYQPILSPDIISHCAPILAQQLIEAASDGRIEKTHRNWITALSSLVSQLIKLEYTVIKWNNIRDGYVPTMLQYCRYCYRLTNSKICHRHKADHNPAAYHRARRNFSKLSKSVKKIDSFEVKKAISSQNPIALASSIKKAMPATHAIISNIHIKDWESYIYSIFHKLDVSNAEILQDAVLRAQQFTAIIAWHEAYITFNTKRGRPEKVQLSEILEMRENGLSYKLIKEAYKKKGITITERGLRKRVGNHQGLSTSSNLSTR